MAAVKNVLKHLSTEVAGRKRKCYHTKKHEILKGETCLVVHDGPQSQTTYCAVCAADILAKASQSLSELSADFSAPPQA
ncbi:hypothetical protein ACN27E_18335 [Mycobacterium sp. WMMD1722]|uniref:hypothetical protein n=1 Tax=Mycobacterium sp. WMMD1722 TaxID=3404117 RepID=UPI003BF49BBC